MERLGLAPRPSVWFPDAITLYAGRVVEWPNYGNEHLQNEQELFLCTHSWVTKLFKFGSKLN